MRAAISLDLAADPVAIGRGETVGYDVRIENGGPGALDGATLSVPLPAGIDQWAADVRIDGGGWAPYPANGLLALATLPAGADRVVEIRAPVELGAPGSLPTTAEVVDPTGPLATAFVEVNVLPSVDAGPDLIVEFGGSVTLVGASAGDGGSGIATIEWTDGGAGGGFDDPSLLHAAYTPPAASGVIDLTLRAVDHDGGTSSDSVRVRVNAPPVVDAGADRTTGEGVPVALDDATAVDADGWIVTHAWSDGGAGGTFDPGPDVLHPTYVPPAIDGCGDATIELTLSATDDWGGTGIDALELTIEGVNHPPSVDAGAARTADAGEEVVLDGRADDADGDPLALLWEQVAGPTVDLVDAATERARFTAPASDGGPTLTFRLDAIDPCGADATDEVTITVRATDPTGSPPEDGDDDLALEVRIEAFDAWGLPLSPLDAPEHGSAIRVVVEVTNTGSAPVHDLAGWSDSVGTLAFPDGSLDPWERATASFVIQVDANGGDDRLRVAADVRAVGSSGREVAAGDAIEFLLDSGEATVALTKTVDRTEAAVGEDVTYTYTIRNDGTATVDGLGLVDDRLGPIPLPTTSLGPGERFVVEWVYTIRASDLPGPLTNTAILTWFGLAGAAAAAADASIDVLPAAGGGGAAGSDGVGSALVISEIAWAGTAADPTAEWIELANLSGEPIELDGWCLRWTDEGASGGWRTIELTGTIDPLPAEWAAASRLVSSSEGDGWRISDASWSGVVERMCAAPGFYLLERGDDGALPDVDADLVYDPGLRLGLDLPDDGAVLSLVAPDGRVVDTANATARSGWGAGRVSGAATMERVNLLRGDEAENWQTSPGILTNGRDAAGRRITGTAGAPNSPSVETLTAFAAAAVVAMAVPGPTSVLVPPSATSESPSIFVTTSDGGPAGGGGAAAVPRIATRRTGDGRWIDVDPSAWSVGAIYVWIVGSEGEAFLLALARGS